MGAGLLPEPGLRLGLETGVILDHGDQTEQVIRAAAPGLWVSPFR